MKIYISTPVNARAEKTFAEKYEAAKKRVSEIIGHLKDKYPDAEFVSFADVAPLGCSEAEAMGRCVQAVVGCDRLIVDSSSDVLYESKGCRIEVIVAKMYHKPAQSLLESKTSKGKQIEKKPFYIEDDIVKWVETHIEDTNQNFDIINLIIRTARHYYSLGIKNAQKDSNFKE